MPRTKNGTAPRKNGRKPREASVDMMGNKKFLTALSSIITPRAALQRNLGDMYGGARNVYEALGYKKILTFEDMWNKYQRQDIAKRVVEAFPAATWGGQIVVSDGEGKDEDQSPFDEAIQNLVRVRKLWHFLKRVDIISGIGTYGVLLLGFNDGKKMDEPVVKTAGMELLYMQPYTSENAPIRTFVTDTTDPRFGLVETYELRVTNPNILGSTSQAQGVVPTETMIVHWSRTIHVAEGLLESNVFGTPRLQAIFNRLENLELVLGGGAEMFWRGAFPGLAFELDEDAQLTPQDLDDLQDEIDDYVHDLARYLKVQGMNVKSLDVQVASPEAQTEAQLKMISGASNIPVRILTGSERGELASTQDENNWNSRVSERETDYAEPCILRVLIDRLIEVGALPEPEDGEYDVLWADAKVVSDKEKAEIAKFRTEAIKNYVEAGGETILPLMTFMVEFLGIERSRAEKMIDEIRETLAEEDREADDVEADPIVDEDIVEEEDDDEGAGL